MSFFSSWYHTLPGERTCSGRRTRTGQTTPAHDSIVEGQVADLGKSGATRLAAGSRDHRVMHRLARTPGRYAAGRLQYDENVEPAFAARPVPARGDGPVLGISLPDYAGFWEKMLNWHTYCNSKGKIIQVNWRSSHRQPACHNED